MNDGAICGRHFATGQPVQVRWCDGIITEVSPAASEAAPEIWLAPCLVDLQVNGFGGIDLQRDDLTPDDLLSAARALRTAGCGRFLLTLITDEWPKLTTRLRRLRALRAKLPELQRAIAGWHIEGPFLSAEPGFHGAHNSAFMLDPTPAHIQELRAIAGSDPLLLTIAPERNGALEAIALAASLGITISLGHTKATVEVLRRAVGAGATGFTHLGNGCPRELDRHDNIVLRVLDTPGLIVSLIPDRIHVSPALFRLIHRARQSNGIYYTADAMSAAGAPPGRYTLGALEVEVGADQIVCQPGRTNFAGSALRPIDGVFRAAEMLGCPWQEIWGRFSTAPAQFMGLNAALEIGQPANICQLQIGPDNRPAELKMI
jgi:N-acetylglucosamine-6-phosphate deacetylase